MSNPKASLYVKIAKVMSQVSRVKKNGYNAFHKYNYATESDLTESIRSILFEAGLAFFSSVIEQERDGEFTKVKMEFTLADVETGEALTSSYWGEGQDKGDKGLYKAYTGATKYFLMKTFLIPTGDDPEGDTSADERNHKGETKPPQQIKSMKPTLKAKWESCGFEVKTFDAWYQKQSDGGYSEKQMEAYLTKTLMAKNKEKQGA